MSREPVKPLKIAVLISGSGRTLKNFLELAAEGRLPVDVRLVISSSPTAGGLQYAVDAAVPTEMLHSQEFRFGPGVWRRDF